jgi:mannose-6-phosphate isomerase-like protein (cupin superfamily)
MHYVVRSNQAQTRQISPSKTFSNYITKDITPDFSLGLTKGTKCNEEETAHYDRIYFVISGAMTLHFKEEEVTLYAYDSCFVRKHTEYRISGSFESVVVNQPAFGTQDWEN